MRFLFDEAATTEAAAYLLERAGGRMNYTVLLKILYLVDRAALKRWNVSVTGAQPCNMRNGPMLSEVYDLIKEDDPSRPGFDLWKKHIRRADRYHLQLVAPKAREELSDAVCWLLDKAFDKFGGYTYKQMIDFCHELPEYKNPGDTSVPIDPEALLRTLDRDDEAIADAKYYNEVQRAFGAR